ncbi:MAG: phosphohydrolase [Candidatus Bathyarchaeota archaeon B26-2]|nr:MAG: phosphohydrolase [Candidatus Bathyarchaeota archaeon B26-2]
MEHKDAHHNFASRINLEESPNLVRLFDLAKPYLEGNDLGVGHTERVLEIAERHFQIPPQIKELVLATIILHDIGGKSIKEQYEKGPQIATELLKGLGYEREFIEEVCNIIRTHHDRPKTPSEAFKVLYDSDQLVKFSEEEFRYYNSQRDFRWDEVIRNLYYEHSKRLAIEMLKRRLAEVKAT